MGRALAAIGVCLAIAGCNLNSFSTESFDRIEDGDTQTEVRDLLGDPDAEFQDETPSGTSFEEWRYCTQDDAYSVIFTDGSVSTTTSEPLSVADGITCD